jgi:hypothetical protein
MISEPQTYSAGKHDGSSLRISGALESHRSLRPYRLESRMWENRLSGSEGGATVIPSSLPLSIVPSLRDINASSYVGRTFPESGQRLQRRGRTSNRPHPIPLDFPTKRKQRFQYCLY